VVINEPNKEKENINGGKGGNIGKNKGGDIKKGIKKSINENIGGKLLFEKKKFIIPLFLGRLRPRSFSPHLRNVILPVKAIKLKKN